MVVHERSPLSHWCWSRNLSPWAPLSPHWRTLGSYSAWCFEPGNHHHRYDEDDDHHCDDDDGHGGHIGDIDDDEGSYDCKSGHFEQFVPISNLPKICLNEYVKWKLWNPIQIQHFSDCISTPTFAFSEIGWELFREQKYVLGYKNALRLYFHLGCTTNVC